MRVIVQWQAQAVGQVVQYFMMPACFCIQSLIANPIIVHKLLLERKLVIFYLLFSRNFGCKLEILLLLKQNLYLLIDLKSIECKFVVAFTKKLLRSLVVGVAIHVLLCYHMKQRLKDVLVDSNRT